MESKRRTSGDTYLSEIVGKTIRAVVIKQSNDETFREGALKSQLFLVFDDCHFELYSDGTIVPTRGLWPARQSSPLENVERYLASEMTIVSTTRPERLDPER